VPTVLLLFKTVLPMLSSGRDAKGEDPALILHDWNFKTFPVSDRAFQFLADNEDQPVFDVRAINPQLYKKSRNLWKVRCLRVKISHMWQFIQLCSLSEEHLTQHGLVKTIFSSISSRFLALENVDVYSLKDFEAVSSKNLLELLEPVAMIGELHIINCSMCRSRAFMCEVCVDSEDVLFPFHLERVYRCDSCGTLTHNKCYNRAVKLNTSDDIPKCGKCERIHKKRLRQQQISDFSEPSSLE